MQCSVGWVGTGVMGRSMCGHLLAAGCAVRVHTRTREKAADLLAKGAAWAATPREAAAGADVTFSMVGFPADVEQVILGPDGVLAGAEAGSVAVDMSTSQPSLAVRIHAEAAARGIAALDAPVSGGDVGAREAKLAIMVGGDRPVFERVLPLFQKLGETIALMGGPGSGQHTKMVNQIAIAGNMIGVVEGLLYAHKAGLDQAAVIDVIGKGAAGSWSINNLGRRIVKGDFNPGFFIKHFVKDMGIALDEARSMKLSLPGLALVHQFYVSAQAVGLENLGTQGLYQVLARMNGM
ncbi:MAG: NAD(P)-dependent oxidoreductase [Spirochaetes bacterium]|nr:NAD(P)-dependent oxidoreductase [Spirochaetota bacterium]